MLCRDDNIVISHKAEPVPDVSTLPVEVGGDLGGWGRGTCCGAGTSDRPDYENSFPPFFPPMCLWKGANTLISAKTERC